MTDERARALVEFVRTNLLAGADGPLTPETRLLTEGLLDSMGLVLLAGFVEERFGVRVEDADLRAGELETITDILALVDRRRSR
jgi:acyl carrier protein